MSLTGVKMSEEVWLTCLTHALSTEKEEIMGLLLGDIKYEGNGSAMALIWGASPQPRSDRRKDRVETNPEQLAAASAQAERMSQTIGRPTRVIGWYHSHPHITVLPSHVDVRTQGMYQLLDSGFIGLIFSCFSEDALKVGRIQVIAFQSLDRKHKNFSKNQHSNAVSGTSGVDSESSRSTPENSLSTSESDRHEGIVQDTMHSVNRSAKVNLKEREEQYGFIWEIIDKRWDRQMHRPLHAAALYLNPSLYYEYDRIESNAEIKGGLFQVIDVVVRSSEDKENVTSQLGLYRSASGGFGLDLAIKARKTYAPAEWWVSFGYDCPALQSFAIRVLSLTCSASPCERNWSNFEQGLSGLDDFSAHAEVRQVGGVTSKVENFLQQAIDVDPMDMTDGMQEAMHRSTLDMSGAEYVRKEVPLQVVPGSSFQQQVVSGSSFLHHDFPLTSFIDMQSILFEEERAAYNQAISQCKWRGKIHPLATIHHTSTYHASLCKFMEYCLSPAIVCLQNQLKENETRMSLLEEEAATLETEISSQRGVTSFSSSGHSTGHGVRRSPTAPEGPVSSLGSSTNRSRKGY